MLCTPIFDMYLVLRMYPAASTTIYFVPYMVVVKCALNLVGAPNCITLTIWPKFVPFDQKIFGIPTMQKAYFFGKVGQTSQCSWGQNLNEHQFWAPFRYFLLLAVVETAFQLIFNIFEWSLKASKLSVKIAQNILVQICLKWLYINTFS